MQAGLRESLSLAPVVFMSTTAITECTMNQASCLHHQPVAPVARQRQPPSYPADARARDKVARGDGRGVRCHGHAPDRIRPGQAGRPGDLGRAARGPALPCQVSISVGSIHGLLSLRPSHAGAAGNGPRTGRSRSRMARSCPTWLKRRPRPSGKYNRARMVVRETLCKIANWKCKFSFQQYAQKLCRTTRSIP